MSGTSLTAADALAGLAYTQRRLRRLLRAPDSGDRAASLDHLLTVEIPHYAAALPPGVAERLDRVELKLLSRRVGRQIDAQVAARIASEEAAAQVLRAVNHYRSKEGLPPLDADGRPEQED